MSLQLEKLELSEHCDRMLAALWSFKAELTDSRSPNRVDEDTNAKFGKLMAKLEEISIRLAERDIDYKLLSGRLRGLMPGSDFPSDLNEIHMLFA